MRMPRRHTGGVSQPPAGFLACLPLRSNVAHVLAFDTFGENQTKPAAVGQLVIHLEIFGFRNHKSVVNIAGGGCVNEMNGEKSSRYLTGKFAGADHEKHERAVLALSGRKVARTGSRSTLPRDPIRSHRMDRGRRYVCVETLSPAGVRALFFFRHDDGNWSIFPPPDKGRESTPKHPFVEVSAATF
jgi:hypothetical protein